MANKQSRKGFLGYTRRAPDGCAIFVLAVIAFSIIAIIATIVR